MTNFSSMLMKQHMPAAFLSVLSRQAHYHAQVITEDMLQRSCCTQKVDLPYNAVTQLTRGSNNSHSVDGHMPKMAVVWVAETVQHKEEGHNGDACCTSHSLHIQDQAADQIAGSHCLAFASC